MHIITVSIDHNHTGRLVACCCDADNIVLIEDREHFLTQFKLGAFEFIKSNRFGFFDGIAEFGQPIGWHRRMIRMTAIFISAHDSEPLFEIQPKTGRFGGFHFGNRLFIHHH